MVERVVIRDCTRTPVKYLPGLSGFADGAEYTFRPGLNIIVGENGSGKTTLLRLIEAYLLVGHSECARGYLNQNARKLLEGHSENRVLLDGADVYADYRKNTFRLCHPGERDGEEAMESMMAFREMVTQRVSSTGEGVVVAINSLFRYMYSRKVELYFNYGQFRRRYPAYDEYVKAHRVKGGDEWTILMDEPDGHLSLENIAMVRDILLCPKPGTQVLATLHNPLLIYALSKDSSVNFVEMTDGYTEKIIKEIKRLIV